MNNYRKLRIAIKTHAYQRYCERVKLVTYSDLLEWSERQISENNIGHNKDGIIHLGGVWFGYQVENESLAIVTCYGKTTANLPAGLKWAIRHNDRINLDTLSGIGVMPP